VYAESSDDEQIIGRVAALDIGKAEIVCCIRIPAADGRALCTPLRVQPHERRQPHHHRQAGQTKKEVVTRLVA
jgi:hypothetical protein